MVAATGFSKDRRQRRGRRGEGAAERHLREQGWQILERRYRCSLGEIDLVALDQGTLVFVEVKTRYVGTRIAPHLSVTRAKQRTMTLVALYYLQQRDDLERVTRFDVIEVRARGEQILTLRHFRDAFHAQ